MFKVLAKMAYGNGRMRNMFLYTVLKDCSTNRISGGTTSVSSGIIPRRERQGL